MVYTMQKLLLCLNNTFFINVICSAGQFKMFQKKKSVLFSTKLRPGTQILPTDYTESAEGIRQLYCLCLYGFSSL